MWQKSSSKLDIGVDGLDKVDNFQLTLSSFLIPNSGKLVGKHPQQKVSTGQVVTIILNGLGFVSAPLYLFGTFFVGKATENLIGEGVQPKHINDSIVNLLDLHPW